MSDKSLLSVIQRLERSGEIGNLVEKAFSKMKMENTPLPGNICRDCGGRVIKTVSSFFRGMVHYSLSKCESCGRVYLYAKNAPCIGGEEFMRKLHEPMMGARHGCS